MPSLGELVHVEALRHAARHVHHRRPSARTRRWRDAARGCARAGRSRRASRLRASSSGVWIVPQATDHVGARTSSVRVRWGVRARTPRAWPPRDDQLAHVGAGEDPRARGTGARDVGDARVLLGGGGTAEHAHARAHAAARVAAQVAVRPAEPLGAAARDRGVGAGQLGRDLGHRQRALDALEAGRAAWPRRAPARTRAPSARARSGGVRKHVPEFTSVVPPTPRPSGSRIGGEPSVVVCPPSRYRRASISGGRALKLSGSWCGPLLEHDHARPALGQLGGHHRSAGARADHADVSSSRAGSRPSLGAAQRAPARDDRLRVPAERARERRLVVARERERCACGRPARASGARASSAAPRGRRASASSSAQPHALGPGRGGEEALEALRSSEHPRCLRRRQLVDRGRRRLSRLPLCTASAARAYRSHAARRDRPRAPRTPPRRGRYSSRTEFMISWKTRLPAASTSAAMNT